MKKDMPLTYEEQLRKDCPALFKYQEAWGFQTRKNPDIDADVQRAMKPLRSRSVPTRTLPGGFDAEAPGSDPAEMEFDEAPPERAAGPANAGVRMRQGLGSKMGGQRFGVGDAKPAPMSRGLGSKMGRSAPQPPSRMQQAMVQQITSHISKMPMDQLQMLYQMLSKQAG